jgi:hypothetical protein
VKKATPPKDANQQNALLQPQWNQMQNWNMGGNYFPDPSQGMYHYRLLLIIKLFS